MAREAEGSEPSRILVESAQSRGIEAFGSTMLIFHDFSVYLIRYIIPALPLLYK
jgi:hypothetical protein